MLLSLLILLFFCFFLYALVAQYLYCHIVYTYLGDMQYSQLMLFYLHPYSLLFTLSLLPRRGWLNLKISRCSVPRVNKLTQGFPTYTNFSMLSIITSTIVSAFRAIWLTHLQPPNLLRTHQMMKEPKNLFYHLD